MEFPTTISTTPGPIFNGFYYPYDRNTPISNLVGTLISPLCQDEEEKEIARFICRKALEKSGRLVKKESAIPDCWYSRNYIEPEDLDEIFKNVLGMKEVSEDMKSKFDSNKEFFSLPRKIADEKLNMFIKIIISRTSINMARCVKADEMEKRALSLLSTDTVMQIFKSASLSYTHTIILKDWVVANNRQSWHSSECLWGILMQMMFYHIKMSRFEPTKIDGVPIIPTVQEMEEKEKNLQGIKDCTVRFTHLHQEEQSVVKILDTIAPYWRIPGVNISGSAILMLLDKVGSIQSCLHTYTPTYYQDGPDGTKNLPPQLATCKTYNKYVYFPVAGSDEPHIVTLLGSIGIPPNPLEQEKDKYAWLYHNKISETGCPFFQIKDNYGVYSFLSTRPGTDIDVPIFEEARLDEIAHAIFDKVKNIGVYLEKKDKPNGHHSWVIKMKASIPIDLPKSEWDNYVLRYLSFYNVEIYCTSEHHIYTHHVAMTRGYVKCVDDKPLFSVCPSLIYALVRRKSPNYYYFAGKKSTPLDVILKYHARGFDVPAMISCNFSFNRYIEKYKPYFPIGHVPSTLSNLYSSSIVNFPIALHTVQCLACTTCGNICCKCN